MIRPAKIKQLFYREDNGRRVLVKNQTGKNSKSIGKMANSVTRNRMGKMVPRNRTAKSIKR